MQEIEVFVVIDSNGDYRIGLCPDSAKESYDDDVGTIVNVDGIRLVKIAAKVPLPKLLNVVGTVQEVTE